MSDISTTDLATSHEGERSVLGSGGSVGPGRRDAHATLFGPGGHEHVLLNMTVQELLRKICIIQRMAQEELSATEQGPRTAVLQQNQGFQGAVQEHQRRARLAVSEAVFSSRRRKKTIVNGTRIQEPMHKFLLQKFRPHL